MYGSTLPGVVTGVWRDSGRDGEISWEIAFLLKQIRIHKSFTKRPKTDKDAQVKSLRFYCYTISNLLAVKRSGRQPGSIFKVARYSFSGPIPVKFEHKLRRHKQSFGKITTTVVLDKDENLLWSSLQRHRSCHSNEMKLLPILLAALYLGSGNCSSKIIHESFFLQ